MKYESNNRTRTEGNYKQVCVNSKLHKRPKKELEHDATSG